MLKCISILFFNLILCASLQATYRDEAYKPVNMTLSSAGVEFIKTFEGFAPKSYVCPGGMPTIGYGHVIIKKEINEKKYSGVSLTQEQATKLLTHDLNGTYVNDVRRLVKVDLTQYKFDALTSFDYSLGSRNLGSSTLLRQLNAGQKDKASLQFGLWANASGRYLRGLAKRRFAEMLIFRNDQTIPLDGLYQIKTKTGTLRDRYQELRQDLKDEIVKIYTTYQSNLRM